MAFFDALPASVAKVLDGCTDGAVLMDRLRNKHEELADIHDPSLVVAITKFVMKFRNTADSVDASELVTKGLTDALEHSLGTASSVAVQTLKKAIVAMQRDACAGLITDVISDYCEANGIDVDSSDSESSQFSETSDEGEDEEDESGSEESEAEEGSRKRPRS